MSKPGIDQLVLNSESPLSEESRLLIGRLTAELAARYDDDGGANSFDPHDLMTERSAFVIARVQGRPVGCGAIRPLEPGVAELKRIFVLPENRRSGVARQILKELEHMAARLGYRTVRLETGRKQPEAIGLYESAGYHRVSCYDHYIGNPMSICFEKSLSSNETASNGSLF